MIYVITGKPGSGKSTVATDRAINEYLRNGRRVVANYRIDVQDICTRRNGKLANADIQVMNRFPTSQDLLSLGIGGKSEETAGLLLLDECGMWLNSRTWGNKDREEVINWMLKSRHYYWDIILVVQDYNLLDKQVRDGVAEMVGRCKRMDRIKFMGAKLPRLHLCVVRYGPTTNDIVTERWVYRGQDAHKCFNSYSYQNPDTVDGIYSVIPPRLSKWRYIPERSLLKNLQLLSKAALYYSTAFATYITLNDFNKARKILTS